MTPSQFKEWRKSLKLTQKRAADELGISEMSVKQYERGSRFDTGQPRPVPPHIIEKCRLITDRYNTPIQRFTLNFSSVTRDERAILVQKLSTFGVLIDPHRSLYFKRNYFVTVWPVICKWLQENLPGTTYMILNIGDHFDGDGGHVLMQFAEARDAANFVIAFRDENDERAMQCTIVAALQKTQQGNRAQ